jgi:hypothetical protein
MLPPGRLRLATRPVWTGSPPPLKTIGMVVVADLAADAAAVLPGVAMTATRRRTRSAANSGRPIIIIVRPSVFDGHVAALNITGFAQSLAECRHEMCVRLGRPALEEPDHRHRPLLRARNERPCRCRAAEKRDELAPSHVCSPSAEDRILPHRPRKSRVVHHSKSGSQCR